jgi:multiple sugar transport system ATP-binding protein
VRDAGVFLFDEPLSNLDAQLRAELRVEIKQLHHRLGATMIFVTHDQIEALTLADRIAVMKDRKIQQLGTPQEVYLRPVNRFVATFVGAPAMCLFPGRIARTADGLVFQTEGFSQPLDVAGFAVPPADGTAVELGVRPEHVVLAEAGIEVVVEIIEPMGSDLLVWTRVGPHRLSIRLPAETPVSLGDHLHVTLPVHRLNIFDAATGARL